LDYQDQEAINAGIAKVSAALEKEERRQVYKQDLTIQKMRDEQVKK